MTVFSVHRTRPRPYTVYTVTSRRFDEVSKVLSRRFKGWKASFASSLYLFSVYAGRHCVCAVSHDLLSVTVRNNRQPSFAYSLCNLTLGVWLWVDYFQSKKSMRVH